jgi:hypothetical protein
MSLEGANLFNRTGSIGQAAFVGADDVTDAHVAAHDADEHVRALVDLSPAPRQETSEPGTCGTPSGWTDHRERGDLLKLSERHRVE